MQTLWFILVAFMLTIYVLLDGFDLGAGVIHMFAARNTAERRLIILAIGPVWDGNEVWLIAAGGTLFFTFPLLYASSFSGFYLPLIIVLLLLMGRGIAIELRSRIVNLVWIAFWDGMFFIGSALLAMGYFNFRQCDLPAFFSWGAFIGGMLASAAFGLYPLVLPAVNPANSLTIQNASGSQYGQTVGLIWWSIGMVLAVIYFIFIYRLFRGKVQVSVTGGH